MLKKYIKKQLRQLGKIIHPPPPQADLRVELQKMATRETADYIRNKMRNVSSVAGRFLVHDLAIDAVQNTDGLALEFGVYKGETINYIASKKDWTVHGFDSFEGLPEFWRDGFEKNFFKLSTPPIVLNNVKLHKGWFEETIPIFLKQLKSKSQHVSYLHIDCDLYSSTKTIFNYLGANIVSGTVIVFDEYFNSDGWQSGEFLAFREFCEEYLLNYEYITYNYQGEQVAVLIK